MTDRTIHELMNASTLICQLWQRSIDTLSPAELEWFSRATESAEGVLINLTAVLDDVGIAISTDEQKEAFHSADNVARLLVHTVDALHQIRGLMVVGQEAEYRLRALAGKPEVDHD